MTHHTFATKADALDAGYVTAKSGIGPHGGRVRDTSGPGEFGYAYTEYGPDGSAICESVTVWLTDDLNKAGRPGAFAVMFPPDLA